MPARSRLRTAQSEIFSVFSDAPQRVYTKKQLENVLRQNREDWNLAKSTTSNEFINFLTKHGRLLVCTLKSERYNHEMSRYAWGKVSSFELATSIKPRAYLCYATALTLHNLTETDKRTIYLNSEQSIKDSSNETLTQGRIAQAFTRKQRHSNLVYNHNRVSMTVVAGKNTSQLGVTEIIGPEMEQIRVTNLERTLIDIVVRPAYAGGIAKIQDAYRQARERVSIDQLLNILTKLDYLYPYHQSIGFLMQSAGYPNASCAKLRRLGLHYDFYLDYGMKNPSYCKDWRVFFPSDHSS